MPRISPIAATALLSLLAACKGEVPAAPATDAAGTQAAATPAAPAAPAAAAVTAIDKAKFANPCLLDAKTVGDALGFAVEKTEPSATGDLFGCTYRGINVSLRLNMIWHDPVYFAQATQMTRSSRPGDKRDVAGDPDKAWVQQEGASKPILHYYRQNVEVELIPLSATGDAAKVEAALLGLPRVP